MAHTKSNILLQYGINSLSIAALIISIYALVVELSSDANPDYKPFCDFSDAVSCSKALTSEWSKGFGIIGPLFGHDHMFNLRNAIFGIVYYIVIIILGMINSVSIAKVMLWLALISNFGSIYLTCIMYFYIRTVCVVCCAVYLINLILLLFIYLRLKALKQLSRKKRE